ncbi:MAG TPA: M48 family metallopeptidase [Candidatus Dormibacteraeota bacterium]|nr:M48 family metallopeptidase [Candidatus Dormibacteraeota bacterium]
MRTRKASLPDPHYPGLSPRAYEHPADRAMSAALQRIPVLDRVLRTLASLQYERSLRQRLLGNAVRIDDDQLPAVHASHLAALHTLDHEPAPELYVGQHPWANAVTIGIDRPVTVLHSALLRTLDERQLRAVLAHEAAHVQSRHVLYRTSLAVLLTVSLQRLPALGEATRRALILVLTEWARASELSCDRAAVLAVRDPIVVCGALMQLAAGDVEDLSVEAFVRQAEGFRDDGGPLSRGVRFLQEVDATHPWSVRRVTEVVDWVRSGAYDRIASGDYVRRGAEPPVTAEAKGAIDHYRTLVADLLEEAGLGLRQLTSTLRDWLRRAGEAAAE